MRIFRWVKQQDFCLRLGLLKVIVAGMKVGGFGRFNERVAKRLGETLFAPAGADLIAATEAVLGATAEEPLTRSDALLMSSGGVSWGQPIAKQTAYKAVEWASTAGFVGRGHRPSERGELWLNLIDLEAAERFFEGDEKAWNPYRLSEAERAFLCYHLWETDELLLQLAVDVGEYPVGRILEARDVYQLTLAGMRKVFTRAQDKIPLRELPRLRIAVDLADTIAAELDPDGSNSRRPRKLSAAIRRGRRGHCESKRKTCKNADHQAIPRFEQLVDLGLMSKQIAPGLTGAAARKARVAWRYQVTAALPALRARMGPLGMDSPDWMWAKFADVFSAASYQTETKPRHATLNESMGLFAEAYGRIHRPVGHTPLEPIVLLAVVIGMERGLIVEIKAIHEVMLWLKRTSCLSDHIAFSAGNDVDQMFVIVRKGFLAAFDGLSPPPQPAGFAP